MKKAIKHISLFSSAHHSSKVGEVPAGRRSMKLCFFVVLCLLLASCVSEQYRFKKALTLAAPVLNSQCPIDFMYGSVERVYLEEDTFCTLIRVHEAIHLTNTPILSSFLLLTLAEDTTQREWTQYFADMGRNGIWFRAKLDNVKRHESVRLYASPGLLDSVFNDKFTPKEKAQIKVRMHTYQAKSMAPYRITDQMTMTDVEYVNDEVHVSYLVEEDKTLNLGRKDMRTTAELVARGRIWNQLMHLQDRQAQLVLLNYYTAGCKMRYTCIGSESGGQVDLRFSQGDLRMLLSHYGIQVQ